MASYIAVVPYQMQPGDEKVVAERVYALLSHPPRIAAPAAAPDVPPVSVAGQWTADLDFGYGVARHKLVFEQDGGKLIGTHEGEFAAGDLSGMVAANSIRFQSSLATEGTRVSFQFAGSMEGGKLSGTVALGEYGEARWIATRHAYPSGGRAA